MQGHRTICNSNKAFNAQTLLKSLFKQPQQFIIAANGSFDGLGRWIGHVATVLFTEINIYRGAKKVSHLRQHRSARAGNVMTDCQSRRDEWGIVVDDRAAS
jgi:hypothetical protein